MVINNRKSLSSSKLVSKEDQSSMANASCRVYYGEAGAVPFMWETQPGTPKHPSSDSSLPPLTPPPSYSTTPPSSYMHNKLTSKSFMLASIFPRIKSLKKGLKPPKISSPSHSSSLSSSASFSSSSWSSSSNSSSLRNKTGRKTRRFSASSSSSMPSQDFDEEYRRQGNSKSPKSILCFGGKRKGTHFSGLGSCYAMGSIRFSFLSIVGHESGRGG